jgi:large subunit ribosomal protein L5
MTFFYKEYSAKIVNYDLLNKFEIKNLSSFPRLSSVVLKFDFKTYDYKLLIKCLSVLELLSGKKSSVITSKKSNIFLKLKKGLPVGCKVILRNNKSLEFLSSLINNQKLTDSGAYKASFNNKEFSINLIISNVLNLPQLQNNYHFFKNIGNLNVKLVTTAKNREELTYLLNSYKLLSVKQT